MILKMVINAIIICNNFILESIIITLHNINPEVVKKIIRKLANKKQHKNYQLKNLIKSKVSTQKYALNFFFVINQ